MAEYTPTTEEVRTRYSHDPDGWPDDLLHPEFDRWLAGVKADAWDEGAELAGGIHADQAKTFNPYKAVTP